MKQKFLFAIASMLLFCTLAFAQTDGIPVELKPYNPPPFPPPFDNFTPPDTFISKFDLNGELLRQYYQTRNYVHCNWGWGGSCDGYYSFNVFDLRNGATIQDGSNSSGTQNRYYNLNIRAITYNLQ